MKKQIGNTFKYFPIQKHCIAFANGCILKACSPMLIIAKISS